MLNPSWMRVKERNHCFAMIKGSYCTFGERTKGSVPGIFKNCPRFGCSLLFLAMQLYAYLSDGEHL